jgi:hypothetical protein
VHPDYRLNSRGSIIENVARGWESKSVESQIEMAETDKAAQTATRSSVEQLERRRRIESLELSRKRVVNDLAACRNPRYRTVLEAALAHLDNQIQALG